MGWSRSPINPVTAVITRRTALGLPQQSNNGAMLTSRQENALKQKKRIYGSKTDDSKPSDNGLARKRKSSNHLSDVCFIKTRRKTERKSNANHKRVSMPNI